MPIFDEVEPDTGALIVKPHDPNCSYCGGCEKIPCNPSELGDYIVECEKEETATLIIKQWVASLDGNIGVIDCPRLYEDN